MDAHEHMADLRSKLATAGLDTGTDPRTMGGHDPARLTEAEVARRAGYEPTRIKLGQWVPYEPTDPHMREAGIPLKGDRVRIVGDHAGLVARDLPDGTIGEVICSGRATKASDRFTRNWKRAILAGRELTPEDYEVLIDNEGPVVRWASGIVDWFPGQSAAMLAVVDGYPQQ